MLILKIIILLVGIFALIASYNLPKNSEDPEDRKTENCYNFSGHLYLKSYLHISIFCIAVFYFMGGFGSQKNSETSSTSEDAQHTTKLTIPSNFYGKNLYEAPYFICRETLVIQKNNTFTLTVFSIGTMATADKAVIKGKFNENGTITFFGNSQYQFSEDYKPTKLLSKWDVGSCCGDKKVINLYTTYFNTINGKEEESIKMFGAEKCEPGY